MNTGIGTAAKNWDDEQKKQQQGIGTAAYKEPQTGIGTPASNNLSQAGQQQPIKVMEGVTPGTQQKLQQAQAGYQPTTAAQNAQQALLNLQAQKPQGYTSKYDAQLESILQQIQGQKDFKYDLNGDAYFQSLADRMQQDAKQASADAMGRAAALTGGYGNSYGQSVASQAYQQALLPLYDKASDMRQQAYNIYQGQQNDRYNQLQMLMNLDQTDYGRYRDTVGDWENERQYLTGRADTEEERGYGRYMDQLDYYTKLAQVENADYRSEQERQEAIRQFNEQFNWQKETDQRDYDRGVLESDRAYDMQQQQLAEQIRQFDASLDWDKMSSQQKYAAEYAMQILAMGQMPSEEMLEAAGLSAEDAQKMMAQLVTGGGGGSKQKTTYYVDVAGNYYVLDNNGRYVQVDPKDIDYKNGVEDTSKRNQIMSQNIMDMWKTGSQTQQTQQAQKDAAAAARAQTKATEDAQRAQQAQNTKTAQQMYKAAEEIRKMLGMH